MIVTATAARLPLADASVHCVVTSPPYWGLRRYDGDRQQQTWADGWRGQLGLEPSPAMYLEHMLAVFAEVRRVLRPDGTLWLNMGDAYGNDGKTGGQTGGKQSYLPEADKRRDRRKERRSGANQKALLGMPWRLALALADVGWTLRSEIIWEKATPMPESVLVLDPFAGTGTVGRAALEMGRQAVMVDVGYQSHQRQRLGLFAAGGQG